MIQPQTIELKGKHVEFIDALKGYAIISVLINHSIPLYLKDSVLFDLWGGQAVPVFLLLQAFNYFKKMNYSIKLSRIITKIFIPFILAELAIVVLKTNQEISFLQNLKQCIARWGYGSGEYYIWQYFQFMLLLPAAKWLMSKIKEKNIVWLFIGISILTEVLCSLCKIDEHLYKFLFVRYFFLIYLGYRWSRKGVVLDMKNLVLSIISICAILIFDYGNVNLEPLFYYSSSWKSFHWLSYFYTFSLFIFIMHFINKRLGVKIRQCIENIGRCSWNIFCFQLVVYSFLSSALFAFIGNNALQGVLYIMTGITVSIIPIMIIKKLSNSMQKM